MALLLLLHINNKYNYRLVSTYDVPDSAVSLPALSL